MLNGFNIVLLIAAVGMIGLLVMLRKREQNGSSDTSASTKGNKAAKKAKVKKVKAPKARRRGRLRGRKATQSSTPAQVAESPVPIQESTDKAEAAESNSEPAFAFSGTASDDEPDWDAMRTEMLNGPDEAVALVAEGEAEVAATASDPENDWMAEEIITAPGWPMPGDMDDGWSQSHTIGTTETSADKTPPSLVPDDPAKDTEGAWGDNDDVASQTAPMPLVGHQGSESLDEGVQDDPAPDHAADAVDWSAFNLAPADEGDTVEEASDWTADVIPTVEKDVSFNGAPPSAPVIGAGDMDTVHHSPADEGNWSAGPEPMPVPDLARVVEPVAEWGSEPQMEVPEARPVAEWAAEAPKVEMPETQPLSDASQPVAEWAPEAPQVEMPEAQPLSDASQPVAEWAADAPKVEIAIPAPTEVPVTAGQVTQTAPVVAPATDWQQQPETAPTLTMAPEASLPVVAPDHSAFEVEAGPDHESLPSWSSHGAPIDAAVEVPASVPAHTDAPHTHTDKAAYQAIRERAASMAMPQDAIPVADGSDFAPQPVTQPALPSGNETITGRFAIGGMALTDGDETTASVALPAPMPGAPPTTWGHKDTFTPVSGSIVLVVEATMNCSAEQLVVVQEGGFAPTTEAFTLRLTSTAKGPFAASGTFWVVP